MFALAVFANTAYGITGSFTPDRTPYVGVVVSFSDDAKPLGYSTGFLLSPTVMLTAGHSLLGAAKVSVCFDKGPIDFGIADDGTIVYNGTDTIWNGVPQLYPNYIFKLTGNQEFSTSDIGLVLLDQPVVGVTVFPELPTNHFVDTLPAKTDLQLIGYGFQYQTTPRNGGVMNAWTGTLSCNKGHAQLISANFAASNKYLRLTANPSQDKGGVAFGDSGGPVIYNDGNSEIVLGINAYITNSNCRGVSYHTRIDESQILNWITSKLS